MIERTHAEHTSSVHETGFGRRLWRRLLGLVTWRAQLVYELPIESYRGPTNHVTSCPPGIEMVEATPENTAQLFRSDSGRLKRFQGFLKKGYKGYYLVEGDRWVGYGWISVPGGLPPVHIPSRIVPSESAWFFYGHTRADQRGRGLATLLRKRRIEEMRSLPEGRLVPIFTDTLRDNLPSRFAMLRAGFIPAGTLSMLTLSLPRLTPCVLFARWNKMAEHPALDRSGD